MQNNHSQKSNKLLLLATSAILSALSILLGKYLAINLGDTIRLSFENFPILLAGFFFGPWVGAAVGIVADLVGCILVGYSINPIITLGAALIGLIAGIGGKLPIRKSSLKIAVTCFFAHLVGSVIVKTIGLCIFYRMPFWATFGWRCLTYSLIFFLESILLYALLANGAFSAEMKKIQRDVFPKKQ